MTLPAFADMSPQYRDDDKFFQAIREEEFSRLDGNSHAYLDFTGSGLYAERQITAHSARMRGGVFGNPHSENGPSLASTAIIERAKSTLLAFLDAPPDEYVVCFTANTTAALKLVAESFPFGEDAPLVLAADNHNSVNGLREFARAREAGVHYIPLDNNLRLKSPQQHLRKIARGGLFAFPAQSNFSGVKHPLSLISTAQRLGYTVVVDAAAFLPTNRLSLSRYPADFVALSAYKVTGYPTGVGALVARRASLARLKRPWFAGGTVEYASVQLGTHLLREQAEGFEDGTPAFLSIAALEDGLGFLDEIGINRINRHVVRMTSSLIDALESLCSRRGVPLVHIYGPGIATNRGGTVAFNIRNRMGGMVPFATVVERAREVGVSLRGGCFCNPGASESAFGFEASVAARCFDAASRDGFSIDKLSQCLGPRIAVGAVRASVGIPTNQRDIDRAVTVVASFADW